MTSTYCACGERLLLTAPGRGTCERCRLGRERTAVPAPDPVPDLRETCPGCGARTALADGQCLGCRLTGPREVAA